MKLIGIRDGPRTTVGRLFADGTVAPLAEATEFYADLDRWRPRAAACTGGDRRRDEIAEVPAVPPAARVLCVGLNYRRHADEAGLPVPGTRRSLAAGRCRWCRRHGRFPCRPESPGWTGRSSWPWSSAGRLAASTRTAALAGVLGYAAFNDLSARTHQMHSRLWTLGKNADRSGPLAPVVTADEVGDPARAAAADAGQRRGRAGRQTPPDMIFSVGGILAYLSEVMTLNPGDVVATGTPEGVGFKRTPPRFLRPGDVVEVEIERVGAVRNPIVAGPARRGVSGAPGRQPGRAARSAPRARDPLGGRTAWIVLTVGQFAAVIAVLQRSSLGVATTDALARFGITAATLGGVLDGPAAGVRGAAGAGRGADRPVRLAAVDRARVAGHGRRAGDVRVRLDAAGGVRRPGGARASATRWCSSA